MHRDGGLDPGDLGAGPGRPAQAGSRGRPRPRLNRSEHGDLAPLQLEELAREQRAERPGRASPLARERPGQLAHRGVPHAITSATVTTSAIARAVTAGIVRNSIRGRGAGPPSSARSPLTAAWVCSSWRSIRVQVGGDLPVPRRQVGCEQHRPDRVERHAQVAQPPDHLGGGHLVGAVVAVAGVRVDRRGREDAHVVIVLQRLHAQVGHPGELADGQHVGGCHGGRSLVYQPRAPCLGARGMMKASAATPASSTPISVRLHR